MRQHRLVATPADPTFNDRIKEANENISSTGRSLARVLYGIERRDTTKIASVEPIPPLFIQLAYNIEKHNASITNHRINMLIGHLNALRKDE